MQAALDAKAASGHTHAINDLTDVNITGAPAGRPLTTQVGGGVGIGPAPMTQAQVDAAISAAIAALADAAPATLDTLNELAAALGDDPNFAATMTAALAGKAAVGHTHSTAEVGGLDATLSGVSADVASNTGRITDLEARTTLKTWKSGPQAIISGGALTLPHTLGQRPDGVQVWLICKVANNGFAVGHELRPDDTQGGGIYNIGCRIKIEDDANIKVKYGGVANQVFRTLSDAGNGLYLNNTDWDFEVRAWAWV